MNSIQTSSGQIDIQEVLTGLAQLKVSELEGFAKQVSKILAKKKSPDFVKKEKDLIDKIKNGGPSKEFRHRQRELLTKSVRGIITEEENRVALEMITISDKWVVERTKLIIELADLWNTTWEDVMNRLNIKPPVDVYA